MNVPKYRNVLLKTGLATLLVALVIVPLVVKKADIDPNGFELQHLTYLDEYEVSIESTRRSSDSTRTKRVTAQDRPSSFFVRNPTSVRMVLQKKPALDRSGFVHVSNFTGQAAAVDRRAWDWNGNIPVPGGLRAVVVTPPAGETLDPELVELRINREAATLSPSAEGRYVYSVPAETTLLTSVRVIVSGRATLPVASIQLLEHDPQSVYIRELSLFRDFADLKYRHPLKRWTASELADAFSVETGRGGIQIVGDHARVVPENGEVVLRLDQSSDSLRSDLRRAALPVLAVVAVVLLVFFVGVFYGFIFLLGGAPVEPGDLSVQQPLLAIIAIASYTGSMLSTPESVERLAFVTISVVATGLLFLRHNTTASAPAVHGGNSRETAFSRFTGMLRRNPAALSWAALAVIGIAMVASQVHRLGDPYMWLDETFSFFPARLIMETGEPVYETGYSYYRAFEYHWLVAQFFEWLGVIPLAARLPNVFFNVGTLVVIYVFARRHSRGIGLLSALMWASTNYVLSLTRTVRMYPMFWFLFVLAAFLFYRAVAEPARPVLRLRWANVDLSFNPLLLAAFVPVFWLAFQTHALAAVLVWGVLLYFLFQLIAGDSRPRAVAGALIAAAILFAGAYARYGTLNLLDAYFLRQTKGWEFSPIFSNIFDPFRASLALWPLFLASVAAGVLGRNRALRFTAAIAAAGILLLGFQEIQRPRYVTMLLPFVIIAVLIMLSQVTALVSNRRLPRFLILLFVLVPVMAVHGQRFLQEFGEVNYMYDDTAISQHKKMRYEDVFDYIRLFGASAQSDIVVDKSFSYVFPGNGLPEPDRSVLEARARGKERTTFANALDEVENGATPLNRLGVPFVWYDELSLAEQDAAARTFVALHKQYPSVVRTVSPYLVERRFPIPHIDSFDEQSIFVPRVKPPGIENW